MIAAPNDRHESHGNHCPPLPALPTISVTKRSASVYLSLASWHSTAIAVIGTAAHPDSRRNQVTFTPSSPVPLDFSRRPWRLPGLMAVLKPTPKR